MPRTRVSLQDPPGRPVAIEPEDLSGLIGEIYDAAINPDLWPGILKTAAAFVGGPAASLFSKDALARTGVVAYGCGIDPHYERLYFERYVKLDPATTGHFFAKIEEPIATADLIPYDEFLETRFYREWAKPQHLVDFVASVLDKSTTSAAIFGVFRHERDGVVDEETRRRMRLLVPHVRRAVLIGRVIDFGKSEAAALADTLDGLTAGMFLVDRAARLVHANAAGHAILSAGDYLRVVEGRLLAPEPEAERTMREAFRAAGEGDAAIGTRGITIPLVARDGECHVAHILPLTAGARRRAGKAYAAAAAIFVHKAANYAVLPPEVIARHYTLTPTELRVLLAIVEVGGVPEVAEVLGVAESTVKTHLGRVYEKTGAGRQADLVKLVAGFANPLVA